MALKIHSNFPPCILNIGFRFSIPVGENRRGWLVCLKNSKTCKDKSDNQRSSQTEDSWIKRGRKGKQVGSRADRHATYRLTDKRTDNKRRVERQTSRGAELLVFFLFEETVTSQFHSRKHSDFLGETIIIIIYSCIPNWDIWTYFFL